MQVFARALFLLVVAASIASAEGTKTWEQSKFEELSKGTAKGVAIRSTGGLELAPTFKALATTPSTYVWAIASDRGGNIYAAAGSPARVYRIGPDGKSVVIFEPQELQVQTLAVDKDGAVYAGTNPDGKVYRLVKSGAPARDKEKPANDGWTSSVFFDPTTKYIWDLCFDDAGNLYVATGDQGEIFRVTPKGEHTVFFKSDEAHIRVLARDAKGNIIAGSDGSGLVYRISSSGEGFVLYSAPKKEITALAIDAAGNIYAAGIGEKRPNTPGPTTQPTIQPSASPNPAGTLPQQPGLTVTPIPSTPQRPMNFPVPGLGATGGSEIYRILPDGAPARIWNSREDLVYALAFDSNGKLLAGSGNDGRVFAIEGEDSFTDLLHASANQVTAFTKLTSGIYASTGNLGKVFLLGSTPEPEGTYESDIFDARLLSRWGRAEVRSRGNVELFARSGNVDNPDRNWSPWTKVDLARNSELTVPAARFVQWKAVLHAGNPVPRLDSVILNYLSKNVAPDFDDVNVQPGVRYQGIPKAPGSDSTQNSANPQQPRFEPPPVPQRDPDSVGVKWTIRDDNDDQMVYSIYYRGDNESRWLLLKDNVSDKFYSFDASLLPDGGYTVKVIASDAPSHTPSEALTSQRESNRFEVDTMPPRIDGPTATLEADKLHVMFTATDSFSPIQRAEYSVDAGDWQFVEPVGQLSDSKTESYDFRASVPAGQSSASPAATEHVVVVRAYDRYDNMTAAKTVVRAK